jgi:alkylhydroperoxidase family enzyme
MPRLTKRGKDDVTPEVRALYEKEGLARGKVPGMFRVFAHRPEILVTMVAHLEAVTSSGTVARKTKELVATLVSRLNHCHY